MRVRAHARKLRYAVPMWLCVSEACNAANVCFNRGNRGGRKVQRYGNMPVRGPLIVAQGGG